MVNEKLIRRARAAMAYADDLRVYTALCESGVHPDDAYLAVKAAQAANDLKKEEEE